MKQRCPFCGFELTISETTGYYWCELCQYVPEDHDCTKFEEAHCIECGAEYCEED